MGGPRGEAAPARPLAPAGSTAAPGSTRALPPSAAELALLDLARALAALAAGQREPDGLPRALMLLEDAFGPRSPLPPLLAQAWLQTRGEKMRGLALGWAREQVRRALAEILDRARPPGRGPGVSTDAAAWLLLAAAEGESHEVDGAVGERLKLVCALLGLP